MDRFTVMAVLCTVSAVQAWSGDKAPLWAAARGDVRALRAMLEQGVNIGASLHRASALEAAAMNGRAGVVSLLTDYGAHVGIVGSRSLFNAVQAGHKSVVHILLAAGVDSNGIISQQQRDTPLHVAAFRGYMDIVGMLLDYDADVGVPNGSGLTPLHRAVRRGRKHVARLLVMHGADIGSENSRERALLNQVFSSDTFRGRFEAFIRSYSRSLIALAEQWKVEYNLPDDVVYNCVLSCVIPEWQAKALRAAVHEREERARAARKRRAAARRTSRVVKRRRT